MAKVSTIREKIAHLLALAESPEPEEAKAALLRARELMAKHKLRPEECVDTKSAKVIRETVGVSCTAMTNPWACSLSAVIAEHYCCQAFRQRMGGTKTVTVGLVGLEDDFEIAKRIFLYAYDCVISAIKQKIKYNPQDPRGTYREKCNAYGWGLCGRCGNRLPEAGGGAQGLRPGAGHSPGRHGQHGGYGQEDHLRQD